MMLKTPEKRTRALVADSGATVSGIIACRIGSESPMVVPVATENAMRIGMLTISTAMIVASAAASAAWVNSSARIKRLRSIRSARTPPTSGANSSGMLPKANTDVTSSGDGVSSRARKVRASCCMLMAPKLKKALAQK